MLESDKLGTGGCAKAPGSCHLRAPTCSGAACLELSGDLIVGTQELSDLPSCVTALMPCPQFCPRSCDRQGLPLDLGVGKLVHE